MNKAVLLGFLIFATGAVPAFSQIEQLRRSRERMTRSIRANEDNERRREGEENALPVPKAARMNIDVQSILAAKEYKSFAEAKLHPLSRIADGDPVWLYVKLNGRLGDYVVTTRDAEEPSMLRYTLFVELGPKGDITSLSQYALRFVKEDLTATEFKIALAPAMLGRNRSIPTLLRAAATAKPGQWQNEIRISNVAGVPRGVADHLTTSSIVLDLKSGNAKYQKMASDYDSIMLRGSTDLSIVPRAGTFFDASVRSAVASAVQAAGISATDIYFAGDSWWEEAASASSEPTRRIYAVFTYRKDENCFYGLAHATQTYDSLASKFGSPAVTLTKDLATPCQK